jgi:gamma-glutamyl-gamma-aminobutyraldehyde dehydrogenase
VVPGLGGVAGEALALSMDVDMIAFTGSGPVGRKLMEYSARSNLKRVSLELGGKSPQIVFADCPDLDAAAQAAAWGVFYNQGEVCTAASRLLVEASIKDAFLEKVVAVAKGMVPGDPLDPETQFGAMVSERQMNTALDYIATADSQGARRVLGGRACAGDRRLLCRADHLRPRRARPHPGPRGGVRPGAGRDELHLRGRGDPPGQRHRLRPGRRPVDLGHQPRPALARRLKAGLVWINGWDACDITMPFGGFKQSGFGRDRSLHALHKYADLKSVSVTLR